MINFNSVSLYAGGVCKLMDDAMARALNNDPKFVSGAKSAHVGVAKTENLGQVQYYTKEYGELTTGFGKAEVKTTVTGHGTLQSTGSKTVLHLDQGGPNSEIVHLDKSSVFHMDIGDTQVNYAGEAIQNNRRTLVETLQRIPKDKEIEISTDVQRSYNARPRLAELEAELKQKLNSRGPDQLSYAQYQQKYDAGRAEILKNTRVTPFRVRLTGVTEDGKVLVKMPVIKDGMTIDYQVTGYDFSVVNSLKYDGVLRTKFAVPVPK